MIDDIFVEGRNLWPGGAAANIIGIASDVEKEYLFLSDGLLGAHRPRLYGVLLFARNINFDPAAITPNIPADPRRRNPLFAHPEGVLVAPHKNDQGDGVQLAQCLRHVEPSRAQRWAVRFQHRQQRFGGFYRIGDKAPNEDIVEAGAVCLCGVGFRGVACPVAWNIGFESALAEQAL